MSQSSEIGPERISFPTFLLKLVATGAGGSIGTLTLLLIFFLSSSLLAPLTDAAATDFVSPVFVFFLLVMIFVSTTIGNTLSTLFLALTERSKYRKVSSSIYQIFFLSLSLFLLMAPVYFVTSTIDISITAYAVALHIILSAQASALILEIVSNPRHSILGVYSSACSIVLSAGLLFVMASAIDSPTILLFAALPIVWLSYALLHSIATMFYGWLVRVYDRDFLAASENYGQDYGKQTPKAKAEKPKAKDQAGADFLRNN